jgi:hypothetical protein
MVTNGWYSRRITVYDCPHISQEQIKDDEEIFGGRQTEYFRSKNLSEFTSVDEHVVISKTQIDACLLARVAVYEKDQVVFGLDLSTGVAEIVLTKRAGNEVVSQDAFHIGFAPNIEKHLNSLLILRGAVRGETRIYTDIGGSGKPIADHLIEMGWKIIGIHNQSRAFDSKHFKNIGTENWFRVASLIAQFKIKLPRDEKLISQLSSRHYEIPDNEKLCLISKEDERSLGNISPDRGDSAVLSFCNFEPHEVKIQKEAIKKDRRNIHAPTQRDFITAYNTGKYGGFQGEFLMQPRKLSEGMAGQLNYIRRLLRSNSN